METIWTSRRIHIRGELYVEVKASASGELTLGTYNDAVQAGETAYTPEQAMELADALTQAAAKCLAARGAK